MGKAMMGTGEAEGEKRAEEATQAALLNPLIDEYSLQGAKGLMVNITGGSDLTLFEVEEAVNKIRAEVDPEAELIFGAIEDEKLNGKIRVSIVATSLDKQEPEIKPVVSMVHRLQNRNMGYIDNSIKLNATQQPTLSATVGATALDINTVIEKNNESEQKIEEQVVNETINEPSLENISMENAEYLQNTENEFNDKKESAETAFEVDSIELATPELFSDSEDNNTFNQENNRSSYNQENTESEPQVFEEARTQEEKTEKETEMFEEPNLEEDFEIPAFLRRQKN